DLGYEDLVPGTERYVPQLRVEVIAGAGHFVHEEQPDEVSDLLRKFFAAEAPIAAHGAKKTAYDVVLSAVGDNKIGVIRELRVITGLELTAVKDLIDAAPKAIVSGASLKEAERIRDQLAGVGAIVALIEPALGQRAQDHRDPLGP